MVLLFRYLGIPFKDLRPSGQGSTPNNPVVSIEVVKDRLNVIEEMELCTGIAVTKTKPPPQSTLLGTKGQSVITSFYKADQSMSDDVSMRSVSHGSLPRIESDFSMMDISAPQSTYEGTTVAGSPRGSTRSRSGSAPAAMPKSKGPSQGRKYSDILDLSRQRRPPLGSERAQAIIYERLARRWIPPMSWEGDTYSSVGSRPMPNFPTGWESWEKYDSQMRAVDQANAKEPEDREAARRALSVRRGRGVELLEIDMKTGKARQQGSEEDE